jgi:hypothetical protein
MSWHELLRISARAGISYSDFRDMTLSEWQAYMEGATLRNEDAWRRTRLLFWLTWNIHAGTNERKSPEELLPLPGDEQQCEGEQEKKQVKRLTIDEALAWKEKIKNMKFK